MSHVTASLLYCEGILPKVSRSFAMGIQSLKGALSHHVLVGYLLCRIADTVEDDPNLPPEHKVKLLNKFLECFENPSAAQEYPTLCLALTGDVWHLNLVQNTTKVFDVFWSLSPKVQGILKTWVREMVQGMACFINRYPLGIRVAHLNEYKEYCYYVAGTVGHLLTDLWQEFYKAKIPTQCYQMLKSRATVFGEALQSINILKDIAWDARKENSIYIPQDLLTAMGSHHDLLLSDTHTQQNLKVVETMLEHTYNNLCLAKDYVQNLPKRCLRARFFCIFPMLMAFATWCELRKAKENILNSSQKIKVPRKRVRLLFVLCYAAAISNRCLKWCVEYYGQKGEVSSPHS
jgi:farnesyl-diphosphate farnesyltransferase